MRYGFVVLLLVTHAAAADGLSDHERAESEAMGARKAAREGRCDIALAMEPEIRRLDPAVAARAYTNNPFLAACVDGAPLQPGTIVGPPALHAPVVDEVAAPHDRCDGTLYLEPSLLAGSSGGLLNRIAVGALVRDCDAQGRAATQARLGASLHIGGPGSAGVGFEVEVNEPTSPTTRLGVRLGWEWEDRERTLATAGVRLHLSDVVYLQADAYRLSANSYLPKSYGVMAGLGLEGKAGAVTSGVEVGVGVLLLIAVVNALSSAG